MRKQPATKKRLANGSQKSKLKTLPRTNLKYKKIVLAPHKENDKYQRYIDLFLKRIFGINGSLTTDESSLYDFDIEITKDGVKHHTDKTLKKIKRVYGVDVSSVKGLKLVDVIKKILDEQNKLSQQKSTDGVQHEKT